MGRSNRISEVLSQRTNTFSGVMKICTAMEHLGALSFPPSLSTSSQSSWSVATLSRDSRAKVFILKGENTPRGRVLIPDCCVLFWPILLGGGPKIVGDIWMMKRELSPPGSSICPCISLLPPRTCFIVQFLARTSAIIRVA